MNNANLLLADYMWVTKETVFVEIGKDSLN